MTLTSLQRRAWSLNGASEEDSHGQDLDVHDLLLELPAGGGVELEGAVIASQIPEEINRITACRKARAQKNATKGNYKVTTKCAGLTMKESEVQHCWVTGDKSDETQLQESQTQHQHTVLLDTCTRFCHILV